MILVVEHAKEMPSRPLLAKYLSAEHQLTLNIVP